MIIDFQNYLKNERRSSPATVSGYGVDMKKFKRYIGKKDYLMIGEADLRRYKRHLTIKELKNTYVNRLLSAVKCFYDWLVLEQKIAKNPVPSDLFLKIPPPPIVDVPDNKDIDKIIDIIQYKLDQRMLKGQMKRDLKLQKLKDEVLEREKRMFNHASQGALLKTLRDKFMISALASSGLRISELLKLTIDDIGKDGSVCVYQGKGNKDRYSFIDKRAMQIYEEYSKMLKERGLKKLYRFTYRQAWNLIKKYAKSAGIKKNLRPHSFRHYFITEMGKRGMSDSDLSKFSGHKNVSILARYKNYSKEIQKEIYEKYQNKDEKSSEKKENV